MQEEDAVAIATDTDESAAAEGTATDAAAVAEAVPSKIGVARKPCKRFSVVAAEGNPLAQGKAGVKLASGKVVSLKVESTSDARPISSEEIAEAVAKLQGFEENSEVLDYIESTKSEFLYSSADLLALLLAITSVKTRMSIVETLAPRLTDPKKHQTEILDLFRFNNDKEKIESLLRARSQALSSEMFKKTDGLAAPSGPAGGASTPTRSPGFGGRGFGGGSAGRSPGRGLQSPLASSSPMKSVFRAANDAITSVPEDEET